MEFYRSLLPPGALCYDVGANIGEMSEAMLKAGARVVAFEPNPFVLPELRARCRHHHDWTVLPAAVGSALGRATFYSREAHQNSGFVASGESRVIGRVDVPVVTLDFAIQRFGVPAFCKIDVEGWELEVLRGLSQSIRLISFEFGLSDRGIVKTRECLKRLAEFGPARANITPAETPAFHLSKWVSLSDLLAGFPGNLKSSLPGGPYGDIFVARGEAAATSQA